MFAPLAMAGRCKTSMAGDVGGAAVVVSVPAFGAGRCVEPDRPWEAGPGSGARQGWTGRAPGRSLSAKIQNLRISESAYLAKLVVA